MAGSDLRRGALCMVLAALLFAAMGVAVKLAAATLPNTVVVFLRSAFGVLLLTPWLLASRVPLKTEHLGEHVLRGLFGMGAMYCFFYAIAHLGLADALLLNYSLPLFVPFVEKVWLGEPIPRGIWRPLAIGMIGLVLVLKPGSGLFQPVALVGLAASMLAATAQVGVRKLTQTEPVPRIVFYFGLMSTAVAAVPAGLNWVSPWSVGPWVLLLLGVSATLAQLLMTRAYSYARAAEVGPFIYSSVLFAALFDWAVFARVPDALTMLGAVFIVLAGVLALRVEALPPA